MNMDDIFPGLSDVSMGSKSEQEPMSNNKPKVLNPFGNLFFKAPAPPPPPKKEEEPKPEIKESEPVVTKEEEKISTVEPEKTAEEPKKEDEVPAPKRRRRRSKAEIEEAKQEEEKTPQPEEASKSEENQVDVSDTNVGNMSEASKTEMVNIKYSPEKVNFKDIKTFFIPGVEDPEWKEMHDDIESQLSRINLTSDMNAGTIRVLIPVLYNLFCLVRSAKTDYDALYSAICDKVMGIIPRQTMANSDGKNTAEQKKRGSLACENFKLETKKGTINLYDWAMVISYRREYLKSVLEKIEMAKGFLLSYQTLITKAEQ